MKTYLQSLTVRIEEWRVKKRDTEEWMRHRQLPEELQERVRRFVHYKWLATRGVDEESILESLPLDLRREIQRHLCLNLVRRVRLFIELRCWAGCLDYYSWIHTKLVGWFFFDYFFTDSKDMLASIAGPILRTNG